MPALADLISKAGRQALPFIERAVNEGLSANATLREIGALGQKIRRSDFLTIFRVVAGKGDIQDVIKIIGSNSIIPENYHTPSIYNLATNYQYTIEINNGPSDLADALHIGSDVPLTDNQILGAAQANYTGYAASVGLEAEASGAVFTVTEAHYNWSSPTAGEVGYPSL